MQKNKYKFTKPVQRIDIHVHLGKEGNSIDCFTAEERLDYDKKAGIAHSVILPYPTGNKEDTTEGVLTSEEALEVCKKYPDHFSCFCNVDLEDKNTIESQVKKYKEAGALGVGEFGTKLPFDDERVEILLEACGKYEMPFLFHVSPSGNSLYGVIDHKGLPLLEKALLKFPNTIIIGHSQPFWYELAKYDENIPDAALNGFPFEKVKEEGRAVELLRKYENLYADLSAYSGSNAILRDEDYGLKFLDEFQDKLMFGSDLVNLDVEYPLANMLDYYLLAQKISEEVYVKVCSANASRLLGLK